MINNFEEINNFISFLDEKSFYFVQVMKRKKDNPEMKGDSRILENHYIFNHEHFKKVMPHIIDCCEKNHARAYIKMNCLDMEDVIALNMTQFGSIMLKKSWQQTPSAFNSACGLAKNQKGTESLHLIDLDEIELNSDEMNKFVDIINNLDKPADRLRLALPTRNGCHLIVAGYRKDLFKKMFGDIATPDDCNTLLYYPASCN